MRFSAIILLGAMTATPVMAQDLADRGAKLFADACLSKSALSLGRGSTVVEAHQAGKVASETFVAYQRKGLTKNLVGQPKYTISGDGRSGDFWCYVASKDLSPDDLGKYFAWLTKIAGQGKKPTRSGPAKWDDGTKDYIAGHRAEFMSRGREMLLEASHFHSAKGPVGSISLHIVHEISGS